MKRNINIKWHFSQSPEKIWEMLTNLDLIKRWVPAIIDFKLIEGFEYEQHQKARGDWDGIIYHKILEIVPEKNYHILFKVDLKKDQFPWIHTIVTFKIEQETNGTVLELENTGFESAKNYFTSFILEIGWKKQIGKKFSEILADVD